MAFVSNPVSATMNFHSIDEDLENLNISELVSILRTAFRTADFDRVEEALVAKEVKIKREIENKNKECVSLKEKCEFLRLDELAHGARIQQLKIESREFVEWKETSEKLKKTEKELQALKEVMSKVYKARGEANEKAEKVSELYEKLLEEVKKSEEDNKKIVEELKSKNSELECAKRAVEIDLENWKRNYEALGHRVSQLEDIYTNQNEEVVASNKKCKTGACSTSSRELVGNEGSMKKKTENQTGERIFESECVVEIIDSDDDHAPVENSSGVCQLRKRNRDSCLDDCEDYDVGRDDEGNTILIGESKANKSLDKVGAMSRTDQFGSPSKLGFKTCFSSDTNSFKKAITSPRAAAVTLQHCKDKVGAECNSHNSKFKSATYGTVYSRDSFISPESDHSSHNDERSKCNKRWESKAEMLAAFEENDELCMEAVCAIYRQTKLKANPHRAYISSRHRGFNDSDALRGATLGWFLTNGNPQENLKKSVMELKKFDIGGLSECKRIASEYSNQLFEIYKNKEDRFLFN